MLRHLFCPQMSEHFLEGAKLSGRDKPANLDVNMDNKPFFWCFKEFGSHDQTDIRWLNFFFARWRTCSPCLKALLLSPRRDYFLLGLAPAAWKTCEKASQTWRLCLRFLKMVWHFNRTQFAISVSFSRHFTTNGSVKINFSWYYVVQHIFQIDA